MRSPLRPTHRVLLICRRFFDTLFQILPSRHPFLADQNWNVTTSDHDLNYDDNDLVFFG
jgi:hypothetical protein